MIRRLVRAAAGTGWQPYAAMAAVLLVFLLPVIANPGYYSHDEWQKADHVARHGLVDYLRTYVALSTGSEFGEPVRPLSFAVQGVVGLLMHDHPLLVHALDVAMHGMVAVLLYIAARRFSGDEGLALVAALVFICSPLAMPSVVWPAALMDRLYVLWGLAAWLLVEPYVRRRGGVGWLLASAFAVALAMLSKETAMVLPASLALWAILQPRLLRERRLWAAGIAWAVPVLLYIGYRIPALVGTLSKPSGAGYGVSAGNLPDGLLLYLTFPFLPALSEAVNWVWVSRWEVALAAALHLAFAAALWHRFGRRHVAAYLLAYLLFVAPVLVIPLRGAHYLYASALAMALATALLLMPGTRGTHALTRAVAAVALLVALVHAVVIEGFSYALGSCMNRATLSAESAYLSAGKPPALRFTTAPGGAEHVLHRLFTGRTQLGRHGPVGLIVGSRGMQAPPGTVNVVFNPDCLVVLAGPGEQAK